jgi:hypothetical protein
MDETLLIWYCNPMSEYGPDELFLCGRIQVEVALGALVFSSLNAEAQNRLQTFLSVTNRSRDDQNQSGLVMYMKGEVVERDKADIITGLDAVSADESISRDMRLAAQALREII